MNIARRLVVPALVLALLAGCKKDGGGDSAPSGKPLITKKYDDVTKEDLNAAITGLGWVPGQSSNSSSGKYSNIMVTAQKDAKTREPKLTVVVFKMPAAEIAEDQKRKGTDYALDVQGGTMLGVKYYPADMAASAKTLARLLGK